MTSRTSHGNLTTGAEQGSKLRTEQVDILARGSAVRIERIVSTGQRSPDGFWYDQAEAEFVLVLSGAARLRVEGEPERLLSVGDWVHLPAHVRHRVEWTDPDVPTIWLAMFWHEQA